MILKLLLLLTAPWQIDLQQRDQLQTKIEQKHLERAAQSRQKTDYFKDLDRHPLNFKAPECPYCQNHTSDRSLEEKIQEGGLFQKIDRPVQRDAHCFGITLLFVKYLLEHSPTSVDSCSQILSALSNDPSFLENAHHLSVNQPIDYFQTLSPHSWIEQTPHAMKAFLSCILDHPVEDYYFILPSQADPTQLNCATIFATLQTMPSKVLVIGLRRNEENHCIAVSTDPEKWLYFNSNDGLYEFYDLETLSWITAKALQGNKILWFASF